MSNDFDSHDPIDKPIPEQSFEPHDVKPAKQGMSRNTKIILGVVGGLLAVCCVVAVVAIFFVQRAGQQLAEGFDNPEAAADTAADIVDYTLPPGFFVEGGVSILGIDTVVMSGESNDSVIMLMSFPQMFAGNEAEMQQQMEQSMAENFGQEGVTLQFVEARETVINDTPTTVNIYEGSNENGTPIRQATAIFESKTGKPSMLMVIAPTSRWDTSDLDGFIDSLN